MGLVERGWVDRLRCLAPDDAVLWTAAGRSFRALAPGDPYLFKLHAPEHAIVGGAFFVRAVSLPLSLLWMAFGERCGAADARELLARVDHALRRTPEPRPADPEVHAVVLARPFFLSAGDALPMPEDWHPATPTGRAYGVEDGIGHALWATVGERLAALGIDDLPDAAASRDERRAWVGDRRGSGWFRLRVAEAYGYRCAVTGEKALPVLEATHIVAPTDGGKHRVDNGLLLRADLRRLFDQGLITVVPDGLRVRVSAHLRRGTGEGDGRGREDPYAALDRRPLRFLPQRLDELPGWAYLTRHATATFRG